LIDALSERYFAAGPPARRDRHPAYDAPPGPRSPAARPPCFIVIYCAKPACQNGHVLAHRLRVLGFTNVAVFPGGKQEWMAAGRSLEMAAMPA
jgi:hypothetical protein